MKKILSAVTVAMFVMGMLAACGTEDDPTLGIDQADQQDTYDVVTRKGYCEVNPAGTGYTGRCVSPSLCASVAPGTKCVGALINPVYNDMCFFRVDMGRSCP